jgi:ATP-binding cassette subfamily B protein
LDSYRRQIGIVYQESFLFSNTVAANIAFGNPYATMVQIQHAAKIASADEFIRALPHGYDTVLGESGVDLSGGQRQRLALARALLLQPPILILDDPTASVDPKTEHEIVSALRDAMAGRTTFVVANRLSLLRRADSILVLEKGRLLQAGTHEQLLKIPGPYQETALLQLMDLNDEEAKTEDAGKPELAVAAPISNIGGARVPASRRGDAASVTVLVRGDARPTENVGT